MHAETRDAGLTRKGRVVRVDGDRVWLPLPGIQFWMAPLLAFMAITFVLVGAGSLDLGAADARLGLAAGESIRAVSQVYGYYAPDLWPGRVAVSAFAGMFEEGKRATAASVLWPAALAAVAIGWLLARRMAQTVGPRVGLLFGLSWFGCLGVINHSEATGLEFLSGLATIGALDRLLTRGSDWKAGLWAALSFLAGGWPPVLLIFLAVIVVGRGGASFSPRLLLPPLAAFGGWSAWAVASESAEAWAATLTWPLTQRPDWWLIPGVLGVGLPFSPFAFLALSRRLREGFSPGTRDCVLGWFQVAVACLVAGTVIPGLARAAKIPALAGSLVISSLALDAAWSKTLSRPGRRFFFVVDLRTAGGLVDYSAVRRLRLDPGLSVLSAAGNHCALAGDSRLRPGMVGSRIRQQPPRGDRSGRFDREPQACTLRVLCTRMELPAWTGPLGKSDRTVAVAELDGLHLSRVADRPGPGDRPANPHAEKRRAPGVSGQPGSQARSLARVRVPALAGARSQGLQDRRVSRCIRGKANPGADRG